MDTTHDNMATKAAKATKTGACSAMARHVPGPGTLLLLLLAGCSALPASPTRPVLYDFGPGSIAPAGPGRQPLPALALADVEAPGLPEGSSAVLYRLAYADARQLHPYNHARWSQPPARLLQQRLREQIGLQRAVLKADDGAAQLAHGPRGGKPPLVLHVELEEFSHLFSSPTHSAGVVRLRASVVERTPAGETLRGQRMFSMQQPASTANAVGGVAALTEAAMQLVSALVAWVEQLETTPD